MVNRPVFPPFVFTYHNNAPKAPTAKGVAISITIVGLKVSILLQMTSFLDKLNGKVMLFGTGNHGLANGACLTESDHQVMCMDMDLYGAN